MITMPSGDARFDFGPFSLDCVERTLARSGAKPIALQPKLLLTLTMLLEANGKMVTKSDLMARVWPDVDVLEGSLTRNIYLLRRLIGEDAIETVAKSGYRLKLLRRDHSAKQDEAPAQSIAVLPFADLGPENREYLADGLTEEIIDALTRLPGYRVVARASVFQFKGQPLLDVRKVALELGVAMVLQGSIRCSGTKIRVTAQLIHASTGFYAWSETYDRELLDILDLQRETADTVARRMTGERGTPTPTPSFRPGHAAYDLYARGRFLVHPDSDDRLAEAIEYFHRAIAIEPAYAAAYASLADAYIKWVTYGSMAPHQGMPKAKEFALRALQIDPSNALAQMSQAVTTCLYDWDYPRAEAQFENVVQNHPWFGFARYLYAFFLLIPQARFGEAEQQLEEAIHVDPLSTHIQAARISLLSFQGRFGEAIELGARIAQHEPKSILIAVQYSWPLMLTGRHAEAGAQIARAHELGGPGHSWALVRIAEGLLAGLMGDFEKALALLSVDAFSKARVHAWLGQRDQAMACLRQALDERSLSWVYFDRLPDFMSLRGDAELEEMRSIAGLEGLRG